ncbi:bestrophin family ion channel [Paucibacter sp. R3-3]|uniref:Bestrophin family ion channel n=1 Tax=Roseateles agri TaxID=3098619 RepID=A0ABU5DF32_9BURK|nr:bestrophin family ion channel [Paucibacter sp. R3-3]MDY0744378.1 bestrophin family ion channel [Paucibacter sp. R3-3]
MIVRPRLHWLRMLFVLRGSVLLEIAPQLLVTTGLAVLVTMAHGQVYHWKIPLNFVPFSLIGLTLAIFLGFRNSTSYARWWEARALWGVLLNETRNLLRQALTLDPGAARHAPALARRLIAFIHALRHQLRGSDASADLARLLPAADCERLATARWKPALLMLMAGEWLGERVRDGGLPPALAQAMEVPLAKLTEALGGCERIAGTPIPFTYSVIIHRTIYLYCLLLPFGLVDSIDAMTPVVVALIAYTFFALEALSAEIEEPFGREPNDLALDAMSRTIEGTLREMMGEAPENDVPPTSDYLVT